MTGKGHPLPGSDEARHNEIPEHLERDKGRGDDPHSVVQPAAEPVTPEGEHYRYDDLGRGPAAAGKETHMADERREDASIPRGQQQAGLSGGGRQVGGGPEASDMRAPGGSSGEGGYGNAIEQQQQQQQHETSSTARSDDGPDRGDAFDEQQGGGRGNDSVSELERDQRAHQDRGQSVAEEQSDR